MQAQEYICEGIQKVLHENAKKLTFSMSPCVLRVMQTCFLFFIGLI